MQRIGFRFQEGKSVSSRIVAIQRRTPIGIGRDAEAA
jgi:hypothetical protein